MILFLDTVSPSPEFCVIKDDKVIQSIQILDEKSNKISDNIISKFIQLQKKLQLENNIKKLLVCSGPGSYTALRVGIAFMYGLSFSKKIPLTEMTCFNLLRLAVQRSIEKQTLFFICSSNDQNFIYFRSNKDGKLLIKKINNKFNSTIIDYNKYDYSFSNYKLPSNTIKVLNLRNHKVISFTEIVSSNIKKIDSWPINNIIKPIYISD